MLRFIPIVLWLSILSACTATSNLKKEGGYITAVPKLDAQHTAFLLNQASEKCLDRPVQIQQTSDDTWQVIFPLPGSIYGDAMFAVDITDKEAHIAPFNASSSKLRRDSGLIAEWIEAGEITTCQPTDKHRARWP